MAKATTEITVKTLAGLEISLADELAGLGLQSIKPGRRVVYCRGSLEDIYRINLCSQLSLRVLQPVFQFQASDENSLYKGMMKCDWEKYLDVEQSFALNGTVHSPHFKHSQFALLKSKDAIVDWYRANCGMRPSVNTDAPDILFDIHISEDRVTVSRDSSGASLHMRGYKLNGWIAPLNEVLAAGIIYLSGWDEESPFYDLMCGSGTFSIEAALMAARIPPNHLRASFGFHHWPDYDDELWKSVYARSMSAVRKPTAKIFANDHSMKAVEIAEKNGIAARVHDYIEWESADFFHLQKEDEGGYIFLNPPYGERLKVEDVKRQYERIGTHLKHAFEGFDAYVFTAAIEGIKSIGLRASSKITLFNGPLESKLLHYELYRGSKKKNK